MCAVFGHHWRYASQADRFVYVCQRDGCRAERMIGLGVGDNRKLEVIAAGEKFKELVGLFAEPDRTFDFAKELRWPDGNVICPKCFAEKSYFIQRTQGLRKIWKCRECREQFSLTTHTPFHRSKLGVELWLPVLWMLETFPVAPSQRDMGRTLGLTPRAANLLGRRLIAALDEAGDDHAFARNERKTDWQERVNSLWVSQINTRYQSNFSMVRTAEWRRKQWEDAIESANDELRELIEEQKADARLDARARRGTLSLDEVLPSSDSGTTRADLMVRDGARATPHHLIEWHDPTGEAAAKDNDTDIKHWLNEHDHSTERLWFGNGEEPEYGRKALMMSGSWVDL